jgi:starch-binding outer membrane protein, SusD/RagB family
MKGKLILLLSALVIVIGTTGCDDFTTLSPISERNMDEFYRTPSDFQLATNGIYQALKLPGTYNQGYWIIGEMRSDNTDAGADVTGLSAQFDAIDRFRELASSEIISDIWRDSYVGIGRANTVLNRLEGGTLTDAQRNQFRGEALFLRSLFYYHLAVSFGNVPLMLDETRGPRDEFSQVPASQVYTRIIQDLIEAENLLPASYTGVNVGRATKGAAATLLARVYLQAGRPADAVPVLRRIMTTYNYRLLDNYASVFGPTVANTAEHIFEVQYRANDVDQGSPFTTQFMPANTVITGRIGQGRNRPTTEIINAFEPNDARLPISAATSYVNTATGATVNSLWVRKYHGTLPRDFDADNNFPVFRYADVLLMLAEALGETTESYGLINQVRRRAGLTDIGPGTPGTFQQKLLHERRVEFAFENHRWYDLLRFGVAEQVMAGQGLQARVLLPIPQREVDLSGGRLTQNPGF